MMPTLRHGVYSLDHFTALSSCGGVEKYGRGRRKIETFGTSINRQGDQTVKQFLVLGW